MRHNQATSAHISRLVGGEAATAAEPFIL